MFRNLALALAIAFPLTANAVGPDPVAQPQTYAQKTSLDFWLITLFAKLVLGDPEYANQLIADLQNNSTSSQSSETSKQNTDNGGGATDSGNNW